jgi:hypothetical protein
MPDSASSPQARQPALEFYKLDRSALASAAAKFVTGVVLPVDGDMSIGS